MVPSHERDEQQVSFSQSEYLTIPNQVHRMLVHAAIADESPYFMK